MGAPPQLEPGFQGLRRQGDSDPLVEGRREKFGSVVLHVIPAKAGIQCLKQVPNTLDPGFHRGDE